MIPNLFSKKKIPSTLPKELQEVVDRLKKSKSKEDCLKKAYTILTKKYRGRKLNTYFQFFHLFIQDINKLWAKSGFLHCTNMNYLMRILLIKSGFFKEEYIEVKFSLVWYISLHQHLRIKINNNKFINIDLWGHVYGTKFGEYTHGFS